MPGVTVRIGLLALYLAGMVVLSRALRNRLPVSDAPKGAMAGSMTASPWSAIIWIWGPTLWFVPGLLWYGILDLPLLLLLLLSLSLPLTCYALFLWRSRVLPSYVGGGVLLMTLLFVLVAVTTPGLSPAKFVLFAVSLVLPALFSIWLLTVWALQVVPLGCACEDPSWPISTVPRWRRALFLVLGYFTGRPKSTWVVEDGQLHMRIAGNPWMGYGPGLLITEPENVVVLTSGSKIGRVAGPGVVFLERGEAPYRVVDLRNQIRSARVDSITSDGIEVTTQVACSFRVRRGQAEVRLGEPWPYRNQRDVLQVLFTEEVDPSGRSPLDAHTAHPWEDLPTQVAAHKLEQALSFYTLDQLYAGIVDPLSALAEDDPQVALLKVHRRLETALGLHASDRRREDDRLVDRLTRSTVDDLVQRAVRAALLPRGLEAYAGRIVGPIVPSNHGVTEQRVEAWKSRFIVKVMDWHAGVERKRFAALEKIRQEAREKLLAEMVDETSRRLQAGGASNQQDLVAYCILSILIKMAGVPEVQQLLPESAMPALEQLQQQVGVDPERKGEL